MTKQVERTKTKRNLNFIIARCINEQVNEPMELTDKTTLNLYCYLTSIVDCYLHEDDECYMINLKQPRFNDEPSVFDFRKSRLKELVVELKARWPKNCTWTDETSLTVVKITGLVCTEQYDRDTYLSNGRNQPATTAYNNYNKTTGTKRVTKTITMEID